MSGWFAMNRAMFTHPLFAQNPDRVAVWAWMLGTTAWKETRQDVAGQTYAVKRGQLLTSYRQMSAATGVSVKVIRTLLDKLEHDERAIRRECIGNKHAPSGGTSRTLITICNYDKYQASGSDGGTPKGTGGAQEGHTKEQGNKGTIPPTEEAGASQPVSVSVVTTALWSAGKQYLTSQGVKNPGGLIGRWLKGNNPVEILNAIEAAQQAGTQDPVPYITEVLKGEIHATSRKGRTAYGHENRTDPALEQIARLAGLGQA